MKNDTQLNNEKDPTVETIPCINEVTILIILKGSFN